MVKVNKISFKRSLGSLMSENSKTLRVTYVKSKS